MIYALLKNFDVEIYALFPQFFCDWKIELRKLLRFLMYDTGMPVFSVSCSGFSLPFFLWTLLARSNSDFFSHPPIVLCTGLTFTESPSYSPHESVYFTFVVVKHKCIQIKPVLDSKQKRFLVHSLRRNKVRFEGSDLDKRSQLLQNLVLGIA